MLLHITTVLHCRRWRDSVYLHTKRLDLVAQAWELMLKSVPRLAVVSPNFQICLAWLGHCTELSGHTRFLSQQL